MAVRTLKYVVVRQAILDDIQAGRYKVDHPIPSERELMSAFGVSRITVRTALDSLVQDGHLSRVQGKGSFVRNGVPHDLISLTSFTEDMVSRGMSVARQVLSIGTLDANPGIAEDLQIETGARVLRFDRVFLADAQPVNRTISYLPLSIFPDLGDCDLGYESLYRIVEEQYGVEIVHARRMLDAVLATAEDVRTLGVKYGDPLIRFQGFTYGNVPDQSGTPTERAIETFICRYRSNPNRFDISQVRVPRDPQSG